MEAAGPLLEAMRAWAKQGLASKKLEQVWSFAGIPGGGGIVNVASLEELDALMTESPLSQFSDTQIYALTDLDKALNNALGALKRMTPPKS
jgi:muconolactone delta-isomerase